MKSSIKLLGNLPYAPMLARIVTHMEKYGLDFCLRHDKLEPLVEFYDTRFPHHTIYGQFVSRYNVSTFLGHAGGLCLDGGNRDIWSLSEESVEDTKAWLKSELGGIWIPA